MPLTDEEKKEFTEMLNTAVKPITEQLTATQNELTQLKTTQTATDSKFDTVNESIKKLSDDTFDMFKGFNNGKPPPNNNQNGDEPPKTLSVNELIGDNY